MSETHATDTPARWLIAAALGSIYLIWGSTYVGIRFAIETLPPFLMAGTRFVVAGGLLYAWLRRRGAVRPARLHWRSALIVGGLMLVGGNGGVTWAEQRVPSALAALMIAAVPLWAVIVNWIGFDRERPTGRMLAGLAAGFVGVGLLVGPAQIMGGERIDPLGAAALGVAALTWATGSLYSRRAPFPPRPLLATAMEMLAGGGLLVLVGTMSGEWGDLDPGGVSWQSAVALVYLTLIGSLVAFTAYIWLLRNTTPARATSYAYVNPVVAVILGWALAGEELNPRTLVAAAIIISAVAVITSARAQRTAALRPPMVPPPAAPADTAGAECGAAR